MLGSTNNVTSLLGHENQLYVGTLHGNVEVYDSESGTLLQQLSLHAGEVSRMLKLPAEVYQCVCAELNMVTHECVCIESKVNPSDESFASQRKVLQEHTLQHDSSVLPTNDGKFHPFTSKLQQPSTDDIKAPLIITLGNGKADWLNVGNAENSSQPHLLTWSGYGSTEYNIYRN